MSGCTCSFVSSQHGRLRAMSIGCFAARGQSCRKSTVLQWFHFAFPISGRLCKPNLVPYDKFRPGNIKAWDYLGHLSKISAELLKYGDEKSLSTERCFDWAHSANDDGSGSVQYIFHYWNMRHIQEILSHAVSYHRHYRGRRSRLLIDICRQGMY